jgi:hypothetical protein
MARRGRGGRSSASRVADFNVDISYDLFSLDTAGKERTPVFKSNQYSFGGVIENFKGSFMQTVNDVGDNVFGFPPDGDGDQNTLMAEIPTLDLTARYLPEKTLLTLADGTLINKRFDDSSNLIDDNALDKERIEYIFSGSELEKLGISEVALVVENLDTLEDVQSNLILDTNKDGIVEEQERTDAIIEATSDIDSILNVISSAGLTSDGLTSDLQIRVSGKSQKDPNAIISLENINETKPERILIEAEDLNDLGGYKVVNIPAVGGEVISLPRSNCNGRTTTATATSGELNLGTLSNNSTYDVEISYFDENDGVGQLDILLNGVVVDKGTIVLNEATSSGFPDEDIRRSFIIQDLVISNGDKIGIRGTSNRGERARVDFISFYDSDYYPDPLTSDPASIADTTSEL